MNPPKRWRYDRWRDLVAAWADATLTRLERSPTREHALDRLRLLQRPEGADTLVDELWPVARRVRLARSVARHASKAVDPPPT